MLKIREDFNLKELEKYKIYPEYECNTNTGETRVRAFTTNPSCIKRLIFKKKPKKIAKLSGFLNFKKTVLELSNNPGEMIDLDTLYDLIKADIVIKE